MTAASTKVARTATVQFRAVSKGYILIIRWGSGRGRTQVYSGILWSDRDVVAALREWGVNGSDVEVIPAAG